MVKQNQGYRKDLNLDETTIDTQALNNLAGAGIAADLRIIQNNLRNTSSLAYSSNSNGFLFSQNLWKQYLQMMMLLVLEQQLVLDQQLYNQA